MYGSDLKADLMFTLEYLFIGLGFMLQVRFEQGLVRMYKQVWCWGLGLGAGLGLGLEYGLGFGIIKDNFGCI